MNLVLAATLTETNIWDVGVANVIAGLALLALFYQIWDGRTQFSLLNKGYLEATPRMAFTARDPMRTFSNPEGHALTPEFPVDGITPTLDLKNCGNLPLKYEVKQFDVWMDDQLVVSAFEPTARRLGLLFPSGTTHFVRPAIWLDRDGRPMSLQRLSQIRFRFVISISYGTGRRLSSLCQRDYSYCLHAAGGNWNFISINDRW
jgi:hypothetical protein